MDLGTLKRTALADRHREAKAKLVPYAGWEMPVHYPSGVQPEHLAVRTSTGIFDVSHMGEIETSGPEAPDLLQRLLSHDVERLAVGGAQYSVLCRDDGGVLDDMITYRLAPERYLTVTNAVNHERDLAWFERHAAGFDAEVIDAQGAYAMLAVQGPTAREHVQAISDQPLPERFTASRRLLAGRSALVCGTGYTGEDGVELLLEPEDAPPVWDELVRRGATPAGLAARDSLRLEACLPLYGNELSEERTPVEAGLGWCCREETGFIGAEAVAAARRRDREDPDAQRLVAFRIVGRGIARQGNPVLGGGEVTSGTLSPCLKVGIGMAYLPVRRAVVGEAFEIDVRGRTRAAVVVERPLYPAREEEPAD